MNARAAKTELFEGAVILDGKYRIVRLLGRGGMGAVWEAVNTLTDRRVAIKCMESGQPDERLIQEARVAARIAHPHCVDIYDAIQSEGTIYLVMEYLAGETLAETLKRDDLPLHERIALLLPAMQAVSVGHAQGVVHRDIKPANLFVVRDIDGKRALKVLDFGISKILPRGSAIESPQTTGQPIGTPQYMSPERLRGDVDIDARSDVYSFGVTLYQALTGRLPFPAETWPSAIAQVLHTDAIPPKKLRPELPSTLSQIVLWAMAKQPNERIPSLDALINELFPFSTARGFQRENEAEEASSLDATSVAVDANIKATGPDRHLSRASAPALPRRASASGARNPKERSYHFFALALLAALAVLVSLAGWLMRQGSPLLGGTSPPRPTTTVQTIVNLPQRIQLPSPEQGGTTPARDQAPRPQP